MTSFSPIKSELPSHSLDLLILMHLEMAVNEPDEFGLAAVGESNEGLNESLSQMYHLAEDAHRQSLELKAVCAKMFEVRPQVYPLILSR